MNENTKQKYQFADKFSLNIRNIYLGFFFFFKFSTVILIKKIFYIKKELVDSFSICFLLILLIIIP